MGRNDNRQHGAGAHVEQPASEQPEPDTTANEIAKAGTGDLAIAGESTEITPNTPPEPVSKYFGMPQFSMPKNGHKRYPGERRQNGRSVPDPSKDTVTVFSAVVPVLMGPVTAIPVTAYGQIGDDGALDMRVSMPGTVQSDRSKQIMIVADEIRDHYRQWVLYHADRWGGISALQDAAINLLLADPTAAPTGTGTKAGNADMSPRLVRKLTPEQQIAWDKRRGAGGVK